MATTRKAARTVMIGKSEIRPIRADKIRSDSAAGHRADVKASAKTTFVPGTPSKAMRFSALDRLKRSLGRKANGHER